MTMVAKAKIVQLLDQGAAVVRIDRTTNFDLFGGFAPPLQDVVFYGIPQPVVGQVGAIWDDGTFKRHASEEDITEIVQRLDPSLVPCANQADCDLLADQIFRGMREVYFRRSYESRPPRISIRFDPQASHGFSYVDWIYEGCSPVRVPVPREKQG